MVTLAVSGTKGVRHRHMPMAALLKDAEAHCPSLAKTNQRDWLNAYPGPGAASFQVSPPRSNHEKPKLP